MGKDTRYIDILGEIICHIEKTNEDKYGEPVIDPFNMRFHTTFGKATNLSDALKYLNRYFTTGFEKSGNRNDLLKAIHCIIFELERTTLLELG